MRDTRRIQHHSERSTKTRRSGSTCPASPAAINQSAINQQSISNQSAINQQSISNQSAISNLKSAISEDHVHLQLQRLRLALDQREARRSRADALEELRIVVLTRLHFVERDDVVIARRQPSGSESAVLSRTPGSH